MKMTCKLVGAAFSLVAAAALTACGGGGNDAPVQPVQQATAEGVYAGTLTGSTSSNAFELLVLENGDFWTLYGTQTPAAFFVSGFVQGNATSNNGTFTSNSAKDYGFAPAKPSNVNATYNTPAKTIAGTASNGLGTVSFNGGPIQGATYSYNSPANLSTLTGNWNVTALSGETIALNIGTTGQFGATGSSGCNFSGTITPRPSGKNVFNVSLSFGAAPCSLPGQSASGIAVAYPLTTGKTQLVVAVVDSSGQYGDGVVGTR